MASVQISSKVEIGLDDLVNSFSKLETKEIEEFINKISLLIAKRKAIGESDRELELLTLVQNDFWAAEKNNRYFKLQQKLQNETISNKEYKEYMELIEESELRSLERVKNLAELAKIRNTSLPELIKQLNLNTHPLNHA